MQTKNNIFQKATLFLSLLLGNSLHTALAQELHPPPTAPTWALQSRLATEPPNSAYFICHPCKLSCLDPIDHKLYKFGKLYRARQVLRSLMTDRNTIDEHS